MKPIIAVLVLAVMLSGAAVAQKAEALFGANCAKCHGVDGKGSKTTKMHVADLQSKAVQSMSDEQMYESIGVGVHHKEYPHAYLNRGLMKEQIQELVKYIRRWGRRAD